MMSDAYTKINDLIKGLDSEELRKVNAQTSHLLDHNATDDNDDLVFIFDAICKAINNHGEIVDIHFSQFVRTKYYRQFLEKALIILSYIDSNAIGLRRAERAKILRMFTSLLIEDMEAMGIPIKLGSVVSNLARIPEVVNAAFPGYAANKLLGIVARQPTGGRVVRERLVA